MKSNQYYVAPDPSGSGWLISGPNVKFNFQQREWAEIICRFMNGRYNAAKGMMVELEKRLNVAPLDGWAKGQEG